MSPNRCSPTQGGICLMTLGLHLELCASENLHVLGRPTGCGNGQPLCSTDVCGWRLEEGGLLHTPSLHGLSFCCMITPRDQSNLWKKEFVLAYSSETEWQWEGVAAGCWGKRQRERDEKEPNAKCPQSFSLYPLRAKEGHRVN